jgi:putative transposase
VPPKRGSRQRPRHLHHGLRPAPSNSAPPPLGLDYQFDITTGRTIKIPHVVEEFTPASFSPTSSTTPSTPTPPPPASTRSSPPEAATQPFIRCDNGPESTTNALPDWCRFGGAGAAYIEPGSPWENPWVESYGSRLRANCSPSSSSTRSLKPKSSSPTGGPSTTPTALTPPSACLTPAEFTDQWRRANLPNPS